MLRDPHKARAPRPPLACPAPQTRKVEMASVSGARTGKSARKALKQQRRVAKAAVLPADTDMTDTRAAKKSAKKAKAAACAAPAAAADAAAPMQE